MGKDVSIVYKGIDQLTGVTTSIRTANKGLSKDMEDVARLAQDYVKRQDAIAKQLAKTQTAMDGASAELKKAKKDYVDFNNEVNKTKLEEAYAEYNKVTGQVTNLKTAAKDTAKALSDLDDKQRKSNNRGSTLSTLAKAGMLQMAGDTLSGAANTLMGSAYGSDAGTMFSSVLSGAASGAAMGSLAGPLGTVIGGAIGGALGGINGATQIYQKQDDAIKSTTTDQYSALQAKRAAELEGGSTIAGGREQTRMAFDKLLGGPEAAGRYLEEVQKLAVDTNYTYDEITGYTKKLLNSFGSDDVLGMLMDLSDATAGLSLNSSDVDIFVDGLNRMKTRGKATREYLDYFDTRGLNTSEALARYRTENGKATKVSDIAGLVSKGKISGDESVSAILQYIKDEYGGLSVDLAGSYDAKMDNLGDVMDGINAKLGGAYNDTRGTGLDSDLAEYGGALGDALGSMNAYIGEGRALAENLSGQYTREALSAVLLGKETTLSGFTPEQQARFDEMNISYANLQTLYATSNDEEKAGLSAKMEALRSEAEGMAESAFKMSDASLAIQDSERDLVAALRDNTIALGSWKADYYMAQEQSKGAGGGILETLLKPWPGDSGKPAFSGDRDGGGGLGKSKGGGFGGGLAYGLNRVPYDDYPALLHEGERVLTAREARQQDGGSGGAPPLQIEIHDNQFSGTAPEQARQIAQLIVGEIVKAKAVQAPK